MTNTRTDEDRWHALMDAISNDIANMPDEMVLREHVQTVDADVSAVSKIIQGLIGEIGTSTYDATKTELERYKREAKQATIPNTADERRSLIASIFAGKHPWSETATLAFRDLDNPSSLTDEEVESILEDLADLNEDDEA